MVDPVWSAAPRRPFTLLLRLLPQHGAAGRLVGHAEVVATSEVVAIGTEEDLIELVRRLSSDGDRPPPNRSDPAESPTGVSTMAIGEIH